MFSVHQDTIRYHITKGNIRARLTNTPGKKGYYIIPLAELVKLYGQPIKTWAETVQTE